MKRFIEFRLGEGDTSTIVVAVEDQDEERGSQRVSRGDEERPEQAPQTFEEAISKIRPATEKVIASLRGLIHPPHEIEMEFGFSLSAHAGVILTSADASANYKVTLHWQGEDKANSTSS